MVADLERTALARPNGRTAYSPEIMQPVYEWIAKGVSPSGAATKCGISRQTLSDWRQRYPEVEEQIEQSVGEHKCDIADRLRACQTKWGTPDPKALELECRRYPEYSQHQTIETTQTLTMTVQVQVQSVKLASARHLKLLGVTPEPLPIQDTIAQDLTESCTVIPPSDTANT